MTCFTTEETYYSQQEMLPSATTEQAGTTENTIRNEVTEKSEPTNEADQAIDYHFFGSRCFPSLIKSLKLLE